MMERVDIVPRKTASGKDIEVWEGEAESIRDALMEIPGDFNLYWWKEDHGFFKVGIVRTF